MMEAWFTLRRTSNNQIAQPPRMSASLADWAARSPSQAGSLTSDDEENNLRAFAVLSMTSVTECLMVDFW